MQPIKPYIEPRAMVGYVTTIASSTISDIKTESTSGFVIFEHCPPLYGNNELALSVNKIYFDKNLRCSMQ